MKKGLVNVNSDLNVKRMSIRKKPESTSQKQGEGDIVTLIYDDVDNKHHSVSNVIELPPKNGGFNDINSSKALLTISLHSR